MADYASETSVPLQEEGRGWNVHCGVSLVNVSLPTEEGDNKEYGNDQWREDVGSSPSLGRTRRNGEDEEDDSRCVDCELVAAETRDQQTHKRVLRYRRRRNEPWIQALSIWE